jgi:hypothetical protein
MDWPKFLLSSDHMLLYDSVKYNIGEASPQTSSIRAQPEYHIKFNRRLHYKLWVFPIIRSTIFDKNITWSPTLQTDVNNKVPKNNSDYQYYDYLDFTGNLGKFLGFFTSLGMIATPILCSAFHSSLTKILKEQSDSKNRKE